MADSIEKQCKTCSHWQGTICEYRPWPTGEACADWEEGKPTSDLINRQTAINTLLKAYPLIQKEKLVEVMETVPGTEAGDCISRKMAIDAVEKKIRYMDHDEPVVDWNDFVAALCFLPSAQPERKKGKWIEKEYSPFYCSVCGTYQYSASWEIKNKEYNFCPRCGADMRGE